MVEIEIFMADQPPRKRRWFSFSLRTFLASVLLIAIALGFFAHRWQRYQHQKATIESLQSRFTLKYYRDSRLPWWKYLVTNERLADDVREIVAYPLYDEDLESLRMFRRLEFLILDGGSISDITPLADLTQLKYLHLERTEATDISALSKMTQLETLAIIEARIADITPLTELTHLEELWLWGTEVTDITPLAGLTQLKYLYLNGTSVADLTPLAKLANVEIYVDDSDQLTVPVELQDRIHVGFSQLPYVR